MERKRGHLNSASNNTLKTLIRKKLLNRMSQLADTDKPEEIDVPEENMEMFYSTNVPNKIIYFKKFYPVDVNKTYELLINFKNELKNGTTVYFGLDCYKMKMINGKMTPVRITEIQSHRQPFHFVVQSIDVSRKIIYTSGYDWTAVKKEALEYLGFYYNGVHENKLCDKLHGIIGQIEKVEPNIIFLKDPLPEEIVQNISLGVTKLMIHYSASTFRYYFSGTIDKTTGVKELKYTIHGESINDEGLKFRLSTDCVRIILLCNYYHKGEEECQTLFQKPKFAEIKD